MSIESNHPLDWGTSRELSALETMMWRADADPQMRSTMVAVEILDVAPDWQRLLAANEWASRMVPRLRDRVSEPLGFLGRPVWVQDRDLDIRYHLRRWRLPGEGGYRELWSMAEQFAMTPFDRMRPPWEAALVEGLPDGKAAYMLKLHHALTDGMGMAQLLSQLHSRQRDHRADKPQPPTPPPTDPTPVEYLAQQLHHDLGALPSVMRGAGSSVLKGLQQPVGAVRDAARYLESARRVLSPPAAPGLPMLRHRGSSWRFCALDVRLEDLRSAAKVAGGSVNDAFLAALLAAVRLYHDELGAPLTSDTLMPVSVPVSVRRSSDGGGGNHIAPARLAAPVGIREPVERIERIRSLVRRARDEPALRSGELVAPILARMPASLLVKLAGSTTAGNDLQASNVPGITDDLYLAGAQIERIYPFAPLPGCAAMICLLTYRADCYVGANLDAAAIEEPELFGRCLGDGFAEVLQLAPGARRPVATT